MLVGCDDFVNDIHEHRYGGLKVQKQDSGTSRGGTVSLSNGSDNPSQQQQQKRQNHRKTKTAQSVCDGCSTTSNRSFLNSICSGVASRLRFHKPKTSFVKLVEQQRFDELQTILQNDNYNFNAWFSECSIGQGQSPLHVLLNHRPPFRVFNSLLQRMKKVNVDSCPESCQDAQGKTPLHIAVHKSVDIRIVETILASCTTSQKSPAKIADFTLRYPLHWACAVAASLIKATVSTMATDEFIENKLRIIGTLIVAYPEAATLPDVNGWTPSTMVEHHKADKRIFRLLEYAKDLTVGTNLQEKYEEKCFIEACSKSMNSMSIYTSDDLIGSEVEYTCNNDNDDDIDDDLSALGFDDSRLWGNPFRIFKKEKKIPTELTISQPTTTTVPVREHKSEPFVKDNNNVNEKYFFL